MMEKIIKKYLKFGLVLLTLFAPLQIAFAAPPEITSPLDKLLPRPGEKTEVNESSDPDILTSPEIKAVGELPEISLAAAITNFIKIALGAAMILTLIALITVAIYYLTSQGEEEGLTKAKNTLINLIIGILIMAAAYGIVTGISQFNFFE